MTTEIQTQDKFISTNGLQFHYRESGDAGAPCLLILHGITGHAWEWDSVVAALSDQLRVLAVDQRGHGASAWASDYAPALMAEDVAAIITALGLGRVRLVGHSMGGINSYLCAACHPALIERLVIVDVGPDSLTATTMAASLPLALRAWQQAAYDDPEEALAEWLSASPRAREQELRCYVDHNLQRRTDGRWVWRFDAARLGSFQRGAPAEAAQWAALRRVTCPTLVIRGADSEVLSAPTAARMVREMENGHLVEISDGGHDLHIEQPEALIAALRGFLTAAR
jgi:pimeloyl-ACP methyl ester carboxylesterase